MADYVDKTASLTPKARGVILNKETEYPHTGHFNDVVERGTYLCRRCGLALFRATSQFASGCGWPSFDDEIESAITTLPDNDGLRTEIVCSRCQGHLGHVFTGEGFTKNNKRHCVNALSLDFVVDTNVLDTAEAIVAGGCFWGVEHYLKQIPGVLFVESGYTGGTTAEPSYESICQGNTGHYEAVRVIYDVNFTTYEAIIKRFFEIHDPTQSTGQGPDLGSQYKSAIFYFNTDQKEIAEGLIGQLKNKGYDVVTRLKGAEPFWPAEPYHQDYYHKHQSLPYCHSPTPRFD